MDAFTDDLLALTNLDDDTVQPEDRIHRLQRTLLSGAYLVKRRVRDL
jgi:hypothetical protein